MPPREAIGLRACRGALSRSPPENKLQDFRDWKHRASSRCHCRCHHRLVIIIIIINPYHSHRVPDATTSLPSHLQLSHHYHHVHTTTHFGHFHCYHTITIFGPTITSLPPLHYGPRSCHYPTYTTPLPSAPPIPPHQHPYDHYHNTTTPSNPTPTIPTATPTQNP